MTISKDDWGLLVSAVASIDGATVGDLVEVAVSCLDTEPIGQSVRAELLDEGVVESYAEAMRSGAEFPPLFLQRKNKDRFRVWDGFHRAEAARRAGRSTTWGIEVDGPDLALMQIGLVTNRTHGLRPSATEIVVFAIHLIDMGMPTAMAAERAGLRPGTLRDARKSCEMKRRIEALGISGKNWSSTSLRNMARIRDDAVLAAFAALRSHVDMTSDDESRFVAGLNACRSSTKALTMIEEMDRLVSEREKANKRPHGSPASRNGGAAKKDGRPKACASMLTRALTLILAMEPGPVAIGIVASQDANAVKKQCREAARRLEDIVKAIG